MKTVTYEVGWPFRSTIRDMLAKWKFEGMDIEWIESSGWFSREFTIRGSEADLRKITTQIDYMVKSIRA